jgi:hypothetical protein
MAVSHHDATLTGGNFEHHISGHNPLPVALGVRVSSCTPQRTQ